jgi:fucose permease
METSHNKTPLAVILHVAFFFSGFTTVLIGPLIPIFAESLRLDNSQLGYLFPIQIAGSLTGTAMTWWFARHASYLHATRIGMLLMAIGVLLLSFGSIELVFAGLFINGTGIGLSLPSINMLVVKLFPQRTTSALNFLNFFWGLGAILCQPMIEAFRNGQDFSKAAYILITGTAGSGIVMLLMKYEKQQSESFSERSDFSTVWLQPIAWFLAIFNFIHIGFETSMGGWLPKLTQELGFVAALAPLVLFYIFFVAGRLVSGIIFRALSENISILTGLLITFGGMVVQIYAGSAEALMIGASVTGFGTSWIFPTSISRCSQVFGEAGGRNATPFFMVGSAGAAAVPWLVGQVGSGERGNLQNAFFVLLACLAILIAMQIYFIAREKVISAKI